VAESGKSLISESIFPNPHSHGGEGMKHKSIYRSKMTGWPRWRRKLYGYWLEESCRPTWRFRRILALWWVRWFVLNYLVFGVLALREVQVFDNPDCDGLDVKWK